MDVDVAHDMAFYVDACLPNLFFTSSCNNNDNDVSIYRAMYPSNKTGLPFIRSRGVFCDPTAHYTVLILLMVLNLKHKGISACTRVALRLPLTSMLLQSLERLLCTVILPSCMYGLARYESQVKEGGFEYLDVVQGRLIKAWFRASKFCSATALREAIRWKRASEVVFCHLRYGV